MRRALREVILAAVGVAGGLALLLVTGDLGRYGGIPGYYVWGWPLMWRYEADLMGVEMNWTFFYEDLLFWVATSISAVELGSHLALPMLQRLRVRYLRRERMVSNVENRLPEAL